MNDRVRDHLHELADVIEKGYGLGPDTRRELASWLRATAEGKDLRRVLGLLDRPKFDRPWWIGLDYLVRYKLSGASESAALDVGNDWGVKPNTVLEAYADRREILDQELARQVRAANAYYKDDDGSLKEDPGYLEAFKAAISRKRKSVPAGNRKKRSQKNRVASKATGKNTR